MGRKILILIAIFLLTPILAGIYGIVHDQISYSISPEYFTKFKFEQFGFVEYGLENKRVTVAIIGVWATAWTGFIIGAVNGIVGLVQSNSKIMWKSVIGATTRVLGITVVIGLIGFLVGHLIVSGLESGFIIPNDVVDRKAFLTVGTMHNFSYLGGVVGLIFGTVYQLKLKKAVAQQNL